MIPVKDYRQFHSLTLILIDVQHEHEYYNIYNIYQHSIVVAAPNTNCTKRALHLIPGLL